MEAHNNWITNTELHDSENVKLFSEILHNLFKISPNHNPEVIDDLLGGSFMVFEDPVCYNRYAESLIPEDTFGDSDLESFADSVVCTNVRYPPFNTAFQHFQPEETFLFGSEISDTLSDSVSVSDYFR